jgi:hypothetical protein
MSLKLHPRSRWVSGTVTPRYEARLLIAIVRKYHEGHGWHNGARVTRR